MSGIVFSLMVSFLPYMSVNKICDISTDKFVLGLIMLPLKLEYNNS